jgi:hypothetical protein
MTRILGTCVILVALSWQFSMAGTSPAWLPLRVTLSAERTDLVQREPIKMTIVLRNVSDHPVNVVGIYDTSRHIQWGFVLLKVYSPNHGTELRGIAPSVWEQEAHFVGKYRGDILPPGGMILFNIYPNVTYRFDSSNRIPATRPLFDNPGRYTVKAAYYISSSLGDLPPGPGQMIFSNAIKFRIDKPTTDEKQILAAIWSGYAIANDNELGDFKEQELRDVIAKYPDSQLIPYAKFNLARNIAVRAPTDALAMYRDIMQSYPGFRDEEVHVQIGYAALNNMDWDLALTTMTGLLNHHPEFQNTWDVAQRYLWAKTHGPEALGRWLTDRQSGKTVDLISAH